MRKTTEAKLRILVLDDDENIRLLLRQSRENGGCLVNTAKSAEEALNTLQRSFFHVVITDIMMGEMSGVELLMGIKKMNSLMQIFVMTSHSTLPRVIQCMQGGAYDFFEKPLKIQDIQVSLNEASRRAIRWRDLYSRHSVSTEDK